MQNRLAVGFISPPDWFDPSPDEFRHICEGRVGVQQTLLNLPEFDWAIDSIAQTEPQVTQAACQLAAAGCSVTCNVGTPFGWAGLRNITEARERNQRISAASNAESISTASAIFRLLDSWHVKRVALACTYYSSEWKALWSEFIEASGVNVVAAQTMVDQGIMQEHGPDDVDYWAPTATQIIQSVTKIADNYPSAEVIIITGAGSRTYAIQHELETLTTAKVIASDTALYRNLESAFFK